MDKPNFSANRDRLASRHAELARLLDHPVPANIEKVRNELRRLAQA